MKNVLFILLSLLFISCSKDDEAFSLVGTKWYYEGVYYYNNVSSTATFGENDFEIISTYTHISSGIVSEKILRGTYEGLNSYSKDGTIVDTWNFMLDVFNPDDPVQLVLTARYTGNSLRIAGVAKDSTFEYYLQ